MSPSPSRSRRTLAAVALVAAGVAGGGVLASTMAASAADSPSTATSAAPSYGPGSATGTAPSGVDESTSQRPDEHLLTGTDAEQARAAALAKYPGATVQRVETDSDGVYEVHLVTTDGTRLIVQMDASFTVTGTISGPTGGGPGGGDHDGDGPAAAPAG